MSNTDYYFHKPGTPGSGAVLDVGLRCPHSCKFCYYSFYTSPEDQFKALRQSQFRPVDECLEILSHIADYGLKHVDVTGGEPTMHPDIVKITRYAAKLGLGLRIITLGQFLMRKQSREQTLLEELLDAGVADFLFSVHAVNQTQFREFTGGAWGKLYSAMQYLQRIGFQYGVNTVVFRDNIELLPKIANVSAGLGAYIHNFILFNAYHRWAKVPQIAEMQPLYQDIENPLKEAVKILVSRGVAVNIRYAPMCAVKGLTRHVVGVTGVALDPYEWRNRACNYDREPAYCAQPISLNADGVLVNHELAYKNGVTKGGFSYFAVRGEDFKIFPEICRTCAALSVCDGIDPRYADRHGLSAFSPYASFKTCAALAHERVSYRAPFFVKMGQRPDMKSIMNFGS
ncbi:radical SAM protein [uncultured Desulfobacter sp.]|uniref:radical SAM protein n=1 Tax=uncultured Desulfobacter sp. TaxID=240139 RepID=UPI002AAB317D|nr:radical SAM protein [uncultured Desulfobacter sp.]